MGEVIWRLIIGGLWKPILGILALVGLYAKGRSDANQKAREERKDEALATHERINDAPIQKSPDAARDWLDRHSKRMRGNGEP